MTPWYKCQICSKSHEYTDVRKVPTDYNLLGRMIIDDIESDKPMDFSSLMVRTYILICSFLNFILLNTHISTFLCFIIWQGRRNRMGTGAFAHPIF